MTMSSQPHRDKPAGVDLLTHTLLGSKPEVVHGFTTRAGGCSVGALGTLNLALRAGESPICVEENWRRVCQALGGTVGQLALVDQVHGRKVVEARVPSGPLCTLAAADAVITTRAGLLLAIRVADCVPVLLAGPGVVGAVHAGWRGVAADIAAAAVEAMCEAGDVSAGDIVAVVGPCISGAAYQVDDAVAGALAKAGGAAALTVDGPGHYLADLRAIVSNQLTRVGVHRLGHVRRCTATHRAHYSHRTGGPETGRQAAVIGLC